VRVEVEHLPQSQVQLQIEVDTDTLGQAVAKAYQRLAGRYRVPGFRPGKAPRAVLERAIGPEVLMSEAADICINDAYAQAIKEHDLHPLGYPELESPASDEIAADKPLSFTAKVYVRPHVQLGDYRSLQVVPEVRTITEENVDTLLRSFQEQQAPLQAVEAAPAQSDDRVTLRLLATVGDETLVDQDAWEYRLNADESANLPIPGLSSQIIGMQAGEIKDLTLDLGEDYTPADYAGKQMALHIEVLRIERKTLSPLDDAFARTLGDGSFESLGQLRTAMHASMQVQAQRDARDAYLENLLRQVVEQTSVEVPPPLVDQELDDMMRQLQENVERERQISMDTYSRIVGKTLEDLRQETRPAAETRVRRDLVLDAIAEAEGVQVPEEEVAEQVRLVAASPTLSNKERRRLLASEDLRQRIVRRLRRRYTIDRLTQIATPPEALRALDGIPAEEHGDSHAGHLHAEDHAEHAPVEEEHAGQTVELSSSVESPGVAGAQDTTSDQQDEQEI
jgi:trigger factor